MFQFKIKTGQQAQLTEYIQWVEKVIINQN